MKCLQTTVYTDMNNLVLHAVHEKNSDLNGVPQVPQVQFLIDLQMIRAWVQERQ